MQDLIYRVRKDGTMLVNTKASANEIVKAAKKVGYNFITKPYGWATIVIDADL